MVENQCSVHFGLINFINPKWKLQHDSSYDKYITKRIQKQITNINDNSAGCLTACRIRKKDTG